VYERKPKCFECDFRSKCVDETGDDENADDESDDD
jgi:hypothetical protein